VINQRWRKLSPASELDRFAYAYDRNGNRVSKDVVPTSSPSSSDEAYFYDGLDRLTRVNRGALSGGTIGDTAAAWSQAWTLDPQGNWSTIVTDTDPPTPGTGETTITTTHDPRNRIASITQNPPPNPTLPLYDSNGNMTRGETGKQYVYDAWNRLVTVKDSGGSMLVSYRYDGVNRRITEQPSGGPVRNLFYSSEWQTIEERDGTSPKRQYVWSLHFIDAVLLRDMDVDGYGGLEQRLYVASDATFNVTSLISSAGSVLERYTYEPYGLFAVLTSSWGSRAASAYAWVLLHQGGRYDAAANFLHFRHRDLSPTLGRWVQRDPEEYGDGLNAYEYLSSRPLVAVDPMGAAWIRFDQPGQARTPTKRAYSRDNHCFGVYIEFYAVAGLRDARIPWKLVFTKSPHWDAACYCCSDGSKARIRFKQFLHRTLDIDGQVISYAGVDHLPPPNNAGEGRQPEWRPQPSNTEPDSGQFILTDAPGMKLDWAQRPPRPMLLAQAVSTLMEFTVVAYGVCKDNTRILEFVEFAFRLDGQRTRNNGSTWQAFWENALSLALDQGAPVRIPQANP